MHRPRSAPISVPPTSSPARPASPTRPSPSGACSRTPSPGSPRRRSRAFIAAQIVGGVARLRRDQVALPGHDPGRGGRHHRSPSFAGATETDVSERRRGPTSRSAAYLTQHPTLAAHPMTSRSTGDPCTSSPSEEATPVSAPRCGPASSTLHAEVTVVVADVYPELLHLRDPLLRLGRGDPLAESGPPDHRRPRSDGHGASSRHRCHDASTWRAASSSSPTPTVTRSFSPTTSWSSAPGRCSVRPADRRPRRARGPGDRRRCPPPALHGGHLRRHAHSRGTSRPASALIVGAGYIGLEMAEALVARGLAVTQMEQLAEVLPTVDPEIGALVHGQLTEHGVDVLTGTTVRSHRPGRDG